MKDIFKILSENSGKISQEGLWHIKKVQNENDETAFCIFNGKREVPSSWEECAFIVDVRNNINQLLSGIEALRQAALDGKRYRKAGEALAEAASNVRVYDAVGCFDLRGFDELEKALEVYRQAVEQKEV